MQGQNVDEVHPVATPREDARIDAGAAADVEDGRGRRRQESLQQLERACELQAWLALVDEPPGLDLGLVVRHEGVVHRSISSLPSGGAAGAARATRRVRRAA